jgi:polyhydroxybutyrate depolymerase
MDPPSEAELLAARGYSVTVPANYDETKAWPLLIALHGYGGSGLETARYFGLDRLAAQRGLFLLAPNGLPDGRGSRAWNAGHSHYPEWDVSWLTAVIHDLKAKYRIDASRVIVFGHSQGAHMAHRMGCDASEEVTAVISVAGQAPKEPADCTPTKPVTALEIHGTADEVIGYYGDAQHMPPDPKIASAHDTVAVWARNDGCTGGLVETAFSPIDVSLIVDGDETVVELYAGCPPGVDAALWTMNGVPHRPGPTLDFGSRAFGFAAARPRN